MNWWTIFNETRCAVCGSAKLRDPFCASCDAMLPRSLRTHLHCARGSRWFVRWWWLACAYLRTGRHGRVGPA